MGFNKRLKFFLDQTKKDFDFDAVAVRIVDPLGYMPFAVSKGLTVDFIEDENLISSSDCACGKVIQSETQPDLSFYTDRGSFWTRSLTELSRETEKSGIKYSDRCRKEGFETLLIAPIKTENKVKGSLFLASQKEDFLVKEEVDFLENEAKKIGEEIFKEMKECDKYTSVIRLVAQSDQRDEPEFTQYMEHIKNCFLCHTFYKERIKFDAHIRDSMAQISPPPDLEASIIQKIYQ